MNTFLVLIVSLMIFIVGLVYVIHHDMQISYQTMKNSNIEYFENVGVENCDEFYDNMIVKRFYLGEKDKIIKDYPMSYDVLDEIRHDWGC